MSAPLSLLFGIAGLLLALAGCTARGRALFRPAVPASQRETFKLSAGPCAAKGYPMTIHIGNFIRFDGKTFPVPSGHRAGNGWGNSAG